MFENGWYWFNTPWACGGVKVINNKIVDACPIYKKMIGWNASSLAKYEYKYIGD